MTGGLLQGTEAYVLEDSPIAVSIGQLVNQHKMPFIWLPGQLPFHVTDPSKLKVNCPIAYHSYADRVQNNVPVYKAQVSLHASRLADAAPNYLAAPAAPPPPEDGGIVSDDDGGRGVGAEPVDAELEGILVEPDAAPGTPDGPPPPGTPPFPPHPSNAVFDGVGDDVELNIPLDALEDADSTDDAERKFSTRFRSMSKAALLLEASSPAHLASHFPHNPFCVVFLELI